MVGLLFRLLRLTLRLALLPLKLLGMVMAFVTCVVPLIILVAIGAAVVWFLFVR